MAIPMEDAVMKTIVVPQARAGARGITGADVSLSVEAPAEAFEVLARVFPGG
ncbi:MAG: hypothetical protein ACQSGP_24785 [Frankia sp.]